jgi:glycosyltransferase involved in cell wall biosynthesis
VKITILSHNLTSNAVMRAHRLALAARHFADVTLLGPVKHRGAWGALPEEPWIHPVESKNLPKFFETILDLVARSDGDVLIAVKPYLASYGVGLLAAAARRVPLILDLDDLDVALSREPDWTLEQTLNDMRDPASRTFLKVLSQATQAASAITVASTRLRARYGGTLVPHGCPTERFDPASINREHARREFGFDGPVVVFPGTRRTHKGLKPLAKAVAQIPKTRLAVLCRPEDFSQAEWNDFPLIRIPLIPYAKLPGLLAAADVVAIPQLDSEAASHQMPMKVYDAMAMGRPIVASAVSDLPATLDGCARLVPPGDVERLSQAILALLSDPKEAQRLGERARVRCLENYSMPRIAEALSQAVKRAQTGCNRSST